DDAAFVEVTKHILADVRDVARDFFGTEFRVAGFDFELFDVNRGVVVLFHQALRNENGVFEVVTAPRHEGDEDVSSQRQLTAIGTWAIGDYLALLDALTDVNDWTLIDTSVLVR